jgi:hypothetical protein
MAASSSRQPPQDIPLPPSPATVNKSRARKDKGKGKAKERDVAKKGRVDPKKIGEAISAWPWVSLTESTASNHPPVFTKDGRCACLLQPLIKCSCKELK